MASVHDYGPRYRDYFGVLAPLTWRQKRVTITVSIMAGFLLGTMSFFDDYTTSYYGKPVYPEWEPVVRVVAWGLLIFFLPYQLGIWFNSKRLGFLAGCLFFPAFRFPIAYSWAVFNLGGI